jgi:hypothetical protein
MRPDRCQEKTLLGAGRALMGGAPLRCQPRSRVDARALMRLWTCPALRHPWGAGGLVGMLMVVA